MAEIYKSIMFLVQIASISCGTLSLQIDNIPHVGENLEINWKLHFESNESPLQSSFQVCSDVNYTKCFAVGNGITFVIASQPEVFRDRVSAKYENGFHVLTIKNLSKTDNGRKIYPTAIFRRNAIDTSNIKKEVVTIEVKAYPELIQPLPSTLYFNENVMQTLNITASGIPRPNVTWKFGEQTGVASYTNKSNYEYTYEVELLVLTRQSCGKQLHYSISGWNNSAIKKTSTVYINFIPDKPVLAVKRNEENIIVSWQQEDYGLCSVNYTVVIFDKSRKSMKSIQAESNSVDIKFSSEEGRNATFVEVTASYRGQQSSSKVNITFEHTTTTPPKKGDSGGSSSKTPIIIGVVVGAIVIIIIVIVIVVYLKKKSSTEGADNSYNHIPLDSRDGAQENSYTSGPSKPPSRENDPDQMLYAELGAGGGRTGPKPTPEQSNYAVVKVDDMGYPARGPTSDKKPQPTYAAVNRDRSRRHSPPPPDDDNEGVIV